MRNSLNPTDIFANYAREEKTDFLLRLAHELTILARDTYESGTEGVTSPSRLRTLNEIQHRILGFLLASRKADSKRYPDDVLVRIILEQEDEELGRQLREAFDRAVSQLAACV